MAEQNPMERVVKVWNEANLAQREHVRYVWPDLYAVMIGLIEASSHIITAPSSVSVPPLARPAPGRGSSSRSAARSGPSGTEPTSGVSRPVQTTLPLDFKEQK